jgi:phage terminase small subunit
MNHRQRRFVLEYLQDANLTQAAIRAGYKPRWVKRNTTRLAGYPEVRAALKHEMAARARRTGISAERLLDELVRLAFAEIGRVVEWGPDGARLRPKTGLARHDTAAIAELAVGRDGRIVRLRLHDKDAALKALARRLGLNEPAANDPVKAQAKARLEARVGALG